MLRLMRGMRVKGMCGFKGWRLGFLFLGIGCLVLVPFLVFGERIEGWFSTMVAADAQARWVVGCMLFGLLALDLFLPVPSSLASTLCGQFFGMWMGFWLSFVAMSVSGLLGYFVGRFCRGRAVRFLGDEESRLLAHYFARHGVVTIVALRTVPILAEASMVFAGLGRMSVRGCVVASLVGNGVVSALYAVVGGLGRSCDAMVPAFLGSLVVSGVLMVPLWLRRRKVGLVSSDVL